MQSFSLDNIKALIEQSDCAVFLDTARPDPDNSKSYLFCDPLKIISAETACNVDSALSDIDDASSRNWCAGYVAYEAAYSLIGKEKSLHNTRNSEPLLSFGVFNKPYIFDHNSGLWNQDIVCDKLSACKSIEPIVAIPSLSKFEYGQGFNSVKHYLAQGESYQVNLTFDLNAKSFADPFDIYCNLRRNQRTPFCSFIKMNNKVIISFSPELFFRSNATDIVVKPMKGTYKRSLDPIVDNYNKQLLSSDTKNRAENLMIVDLMRNDLGRICLPGTIIADPLFEVESHPTLFQMTSTITGKLSKDIGFYQIFKNIFPCGSITGAPKHRTIEIINELEKGERGVYCGAIGFTAPTGSSCFSIPIRTIQKKGSVLKYRVGSGIVWDSDLDGEWQESLDKGHILSSIIPSFEIIESILYDKDLLYSNEHKQRMKRSAAFFGVPFSDKRWDVEVSKYLSSIDTTKRYKIRILLDECGMFSIEKQMIKDPEFSVPIVTLSTDKTTRNNMLLYHKTTYRPWYTNAEKLIAKNGQYDQLFINELNEITEGARNNIFAKIDGTLYTPPISCGLLPGIMRQELISSKQCRERILYVDDMYNAEAIYCGNSVRGLVEVQIRMS